MMEGKIFVIGLQRTGTTSLYYALKMLGINAAPHAIPLFYNSKDPILEVYDAFADNPIPLIYKELDKNIPGCKFILTTRSQGAWLKSVAWLFNKEMKTLPKKLQKVGNEIHRSFYGIQHFDTQHFTAKWQAYHKEVFNYFKGREEDLLVLDFEHKIGWEPLCSFLNKDIPTPAFPHKNKAS